MIDKDKVIEEADEALEVSMMMPNKKVQKQQENILIQLNRVERDVNKIAARMERLSQSKKSTFLTDRYRNSVLFSDIPRPSEEKQMEKSKEKQQTSAYKQNIIGKYNYYGQKYRFQQKQEDLHVSKVELSEVCKSDLPPKQQKKINFDQQSVNLQKSQVRDEQDSLFMNREEIKLPSQQYYIVFDKEKERQKNKHRTLMQDMLQTGKSQFIRSKQASNSVQIKKGSTHNISLFDPKATYQEFKSNASINVSKKGFTSSQLRPERDIIFDKPKWILQKKINELQKQVKRLKTKEQLREQIGRIGRVDGRIKLKNNVQRMLDDLFP